MQGAPAETKASRRGKDGPLTYFLILSLQSGLFAELWVPAADWSLVNTTEMPRRHWAHRSTLSKTKGLFLKSRSPTGCPRQGHRQQHLGRDSSPDTCRSPGSLPEDLPHPGPRLSGVRRPADCHSHRVTPGHPCSPGTGRMAPPTDCSSSHPPSPRACAPRHKPGPSHGTRKPPAPPPLQDDIQCPRGP